MQRLVLGLLHLIHNAECPTNPAPCGCFLDMSLQNNTRLGVVPKDQLQARVNCTRRFPASSPGPGITKLPLFGGHGSLLNLLGLEVVSAHRKRPAPSFIFGCGVHRGQALLSCTFQIWLSPEWLISSSPASHPKPWSSTSAPQISVMYTKTALGDEAFERNGKMRR